MILILILTILSSANGSNPNCDSNLCEHCWKHSPEFCIECSFGYFLDADSFEEYGRKGGTCGKYKCLPEQGQLTLSYITQNHIEINQQVCLLSGCPHKDVCAKLKKRGGAIQCSYICEGPMESQLIGQILIVCGYWLKYSNAAINQNKTHDKVKTGGIDINDFHTPHYFDFGPNARPSWGASARTFGGAAY